MSFNLFLPISFYFQLFPDTEKALKSKAVSLSKAAKIKKYSTIKNSYFCTNYWKSDL
jgi:hypothetical protein